MVEARFRMRIKGPAKRRSQMEILEVGMCISAFLGFLGAAGVVTLPWMQASFWFMSFCWWGLGLMKWIQSGHFRIEFSDISTTELRGFITALQKTQEEWKKLEHQAQDHERKAA